MAIKHLTYKAIPRARRRKQAARATAKMRERLQLDPTLTDEQRQAVHDKIVHIQKWVNGDLETGPKPEMVLPEAPVHHEIIVEEELGVSEGVD